jgi:hypothetical protein
VWGIIGLILIGVGVAVIRVSVVKYVPSLSSITSNPSHPSSYLSGFGSSGFIFGALGGAALMIVGDIVIVLGIMASFFKISAEMIAQEVQRRTSQTPPETPLNSLRHLGKQHARGSARV